MQNLEEFLEFKNHVHTWHNKFYDEFIGRFDKIEDLLPFYLQAQHGLANPLTDERYNNPDDVEFLKKEYNQWFTIHTIEKRMSEIIDDLKTEKAIELDNPYHIGGRMMGHDLFSLEATIFNFMDMMISDEESMVDEEIQTELQRVAANAYIFQKTANYVLTGNDPEHIVNIDPDRVNHYLMAVHKDENKIHNYLKDPLLGTQYVPIMQMIKNSGKYAKDVSPEIWMSDGSLRTLAVSNSGDGVDLTKEEIPNIFRGHTTEGTGLGLSLSNRLVDDGGGVIELYTVDKNGNNVDYHTDWEAAHISTIESPRKGSYFQIKLPRNPAVKSQ